MNICSARLNIELISELTKSGQCVQICGGNFSERALICRQSSQYSTQYYARMRTIVGQIVRSRTGADSEVIEGRAVRCEFEGLQREIIEEAAQTCRHQCEGCSVLIQHLAHHTTLPMQLSIYGRCVTCQCTVQISEHGEHEAGSLGNLLMTTRLFDDLSDHLFAVQGSVTRVKQRSAHSPRWVQQVQRQIGLITRALRTAPLCIGCEGAQLIEGSEGARQHVVAWHQSCI